MNEEKDKEIVQEENLETEVQVEIEEEVEEAGEEILSEEETTPQEPLLITLEQIRAYRLLKMEEKLESLDDGDYKKAQLASKIEEKKKKWFPNTIWNSKEQGTYKKPKAEEVSL